MSLKIHQAVALSCSLFLSFSLTAQELDVRNVVQHTLNTNPDIQASLQDLKLAQLQVQDAKGALRPTVDVTASAAYVDQNIGRDPEYGEYQGQIALSQLLYDGSLTYNNIRSLKQGQVVRLYQLYAEVEQTAQEAVEAYLDILLYRELMRTAEDNLRTHVSVFKQVDKSAAAGVARGADLEQINGRLSLSESNIITEQSNLHDVSARFLRITGVDPNLSLSPYAPSTQGYNEQSVVTIIENAYVTNPSLQASIYNIDARQFDKKSVQGLYKPVVRLGVSYGTQNRDETGADNTLTEARAGLSVSYNLYNGGRDKTAIKTALLQIDQAKDLRDGACRDMRQTIQIAFNDINNLSRQLPTLNEHRLSSARVRTAYLGQFKLGQRTLLDLLDSENEAYEAARAYTLAKYTQYKAVVRLLAARGTLTESLKLTPNGWPAAAELAQRPVNYDPQYICPAINTANLGTAGNILSQDSDNDGVTDLWDDCNDTQPGAKVDINGCAVTARPVIKNEQAIPSDTPSDTASSFNKSFLEQVPVQKNITIAVQFEKSTANFLNSEETRLDELLNTLRSDSDKAVIIEGHTSIDGAERYNQKLGFLRAEAVADWLEQQGGIDAQRIVTVRYGESMPLAAGNTNSAHQKNRRIEAKIVALKDLVEGRTQ